MASNNFLRRPAVEAKTGLKRSTIYKFLKDGTFPKPIKIGSRSVAWIESEIEDWKAAHIAASRSE